MTTKVLFEYSMMAQVAVAVTCLGLLWRKQLMRTFSPVAAFLAVVCVHESTAVATLFFRQQLGIDKHLALEIYLWSQWVCSVLEYGLLLLVIYGVFREAIKPMAGLQHVGKIVFRWVAGVSLILAIGLAFSPHVGTSGGGTYIGALASRVMQGTSVLMLCLLLFVCFTTRPLGLTYASRIFGVSLGMGIFSTVNLVSAAWVSLHSAATSVYAPVYMVSSLGFSAGLVVWAVYFAKNEPERRLILLPTTSPFFFWNRISEALGDAPGQVAVAGFKPDMLAPGELQMLTIVSRTTRERQRELAEAEAREQAELARQSGLHTVVPMHR